MSKRLRIWLFVLLGTLLTSTSLPAEGVITMTTSNLVRGRIDLAIKANGPVSISGVREPAGTDGITHWYTLTSQTITIRGDVTYLDCAWGQLTSLDVSGCTSLTELSCYNNRINGEAMTKLVNSLPDRTGKSSGSFRVMRSGPYSEYENNQCSPSDISIVRNKNWNPQWSNRDPYIAPGESVSTMTTSKAVGEKISLAIKANGNVTIEGVGETPQLDGQSHSYTLTSQTITIRGHVASLDCSGNQLTGLDLTRSTALITLNCSNNQLTSLDLSKNVALITLNCASNQLTSLDLSNHSALERLSCEKNQLIRPNLSGCSSLKELSCHTNQLIRLDISACRGLTKLHCYGNQLTSLNASGCTALTELYCYNNRINGEEMTNLVNSLPNRKGMTAGVFKVVQDTQSEKNQCRPSDLAIAKEKNWDSQWSDGSPYSISIGKGVSTMTTVKAIGETIDLSIKAKGDIIIKGVKDTPLPEGKIHRCTLTSQTVTILGDVTELKCYDNQLTNLDVSKNPALTTLVCYKNRINGEAMTQLVNSLPNRTGMSAGTFIVMQNTPEEKNICRAADLAIAKEKNWLPRWSDDSPYSIDMGNGVSTLTTAKAIGETIDLSFKAKEDIVIKGVKEYPLPDGKTHRCTLTSQTVTILGDVTELQCSGNQLTGVDLTKSTDLTSLNCSNNLLTSLDVSKNTALAKIECYNNRINGEEMTNLVNSLPNRKGMSSGDLFVVCNDKGEGNWCSLSDVLIAREKNWNTKWQNGDPYKGVGSGVITMTTAKAIGETIKLGIKASDAIFIDGVRGTLSQDGTMQRYTLTSNTLTIRGNVIELSCAGSQLTSLDVSNCTSLISLNCQNNELTSLDVSSCISLTSLNCQDNKLASLDVSKNSALTTLDCNRNQLSSLKVSGCTVLTKLNCAANKLESLPLLACISLTELNCEENQLTGLNLFDCKELKSLYCIKNKLNGKAMSSLIESLPDRTGRSEGRIKMYSEYVVSDETFAYQYDVRAAQKKNWKLFYNDSTPYKGAPNPICSVTKSVEGKGSLSIMGAIDLGIVAYGTKLTVVATPKANYELVSLTANGVDILATKEFVVKEDVTVEAVFSGHTFNVTLEKEGAGELIAVGLDDTHEAAYGTELTIIATPATGYELTALTANGTDILATKKVVVTENMTIKATFVKKTFAVSLTKVGEGTITATGATNLNAVAYGTELTINTTPAMGYELISITAGGSDITATKKVIVKDNVTVKATFAKKSFAVTFEKVGEGRITATGASNLNSVAYGTELTINATPATGYELVSITAGGTDITATKKIVVKGHVTVKATFAKKAFAVSLTKEGEGTISATGASNLNSVAYGTELTINATPATGYELVSITAGSADITTTKKIVVTGNLTVKATFAKKSFAVSLTKEGEGTITATGASNLNSVAYGTELTINATPATGYELVSITAGSADITTTKKIVVTGNLTVKATFAKKNFAVSLTKEGEGTITATGASNLNSVAYGTELTINATPAEGYELVSITAGGTDITASKKIIVKDNLTVKATFAKKSFSVSLTKEGEGTISATGATSLDAVAYGTELTIVATPAKGYELVSITAGGTDITATKKVVVTGNLTVKAIFAKKVFAVSLTKEGEGMITATGASNLNSVAYGTELTIVATPAEGYELVSITAGGTDITATKKVVVTGNLTVKAIFAKKTFAVTLTSNEHGDITIVEPVNLDAVPYGTTLTVKATGKNAQCELTALTANGQDILATQSFVVTGPTEVKATFVDHTSVETTVTQQVQLYPNPATDYVMVEGVAPASEVTLHSMTGERLYAGRADSRGVLQIDLTPYADGVYLVCVAGETYRVVVRR